jgi:hypothetical protein
MLETLVGGSVSPLVEQQRLRPVALAEVLDLADDEIVVAGLVDVLDRQSTRPTAPSRSGTFRAKPQEAPALMF